MMQAFSRISIVNAGRNLLLALPVTYRWLL